MTITELIEALKSYPQDAIVHYFDSEHGWCEASSITPLIEKQWFPEHPNMDLESPQENDVLPEKLNNIGLR